MPLLYQKGYRRKSWERRRYEGNFPVDGLRSVQNWTQYKIDRQVEEISVRSQSKSRLKSKYLYSVS